MVAWMRQLEDEEGLSPLWEVFFQIAAYPVPQVRILDINVLPYASSPGQVFPKYWCQRHMHCAHCSTPTEAFRSGFLLQPRRRGSCFATHMALGRMIRRSSCSKQ